MFASYQDRINHHAKLVFEKLLAMDSRVTQAIHYSFFNGGKRVRPSLVYALAETLAIPLDKVDDIALSIECIHAYSLIHDDLPAMDDDDLRRGKLSCHKAFDEATAILAGDALNTLAFEVLAQSKYYHLNLSQQIITLAQNVGSKGMILGQDMDMQSSSHFQLDDLKVLHDCKTGKLIQACFEMTLNVSSQLDKDKLMQAAKLLGVIYQIQDDILDATQTTEVLGKPSQSDEKNAKITYVSLLGIEKAKQQQQQFTQQMQNLLDDTLKKFDSKPLWAVLNRLLKRQQ